MIGTQKGRTRLQAATDIVTQTKWPLLGATVIAVTAFAPIGLSEDATGEYCGTLFTVLLISLMLSWFTAISLTPFLPICSSVVRKRQPAVKKAIPTKVLSLWSIADSLSFV